MTRALLDVNVLLALLDRSHHHHRVARTWLTDQQTPFWASCAVTQNGYIRVVTQSTYPNTISVASACVRLESACRTTVHEFWTCDVSLLDSSIRRSRLLGPKRITDVYLLALAVAHAGRLVTFDRGVDLASVEGAEPDHLVVL